MTMTTVHVMTAKNQCKFVDADAEPKEPVNPYNSGTPDKQVLTNIIRDKLKAYLMNGSK